MVAINRAIESYERKTQERQFNASHSGKKLDSSEKFSQRGRALDTLAGFGVSRNTLKKAEKYNHPSKCALSLFLCGLIENHCYFFFLQ